MRIHATFALLQGVFLPAVLSSPIIDNDTNHPTRLIHRMLANHAPVPANAIPSFVSAADNTTKTNTTATNTIDEIPLTTLWPWYDYSLPPPTIDPWYEAPPNWEAAAPGTPLRIRPHAYPTINIRQCLDTFQVLYRSADTHGKPSWAVTTVFLPHVHANCTAENPCVRNIVSYQVPSDSVWPDAAPSYLLQAREPYGEIRDMLARGWAVSVPDYEGPLAAYCAGRQAGYATLDAARAVLAAGPRFGIDGEKSKVALWGYSGGAFATGFAAELAGEYAPELVSSGKLAGAIVGGAAPNLTTVAMAMNKKDTAGLVVASVMGVTMQQPEARAHIMSRLKKEGRYNVTGFTSVQWMTGYDALVAFSKHDVYDYFEGGAADLWHPVMQEVIDRDAVMGVVGAPPRELPVFVYKAIQDEMSSIEESDGLVRFYCDKGSRVLYHRNAMGTHNDELWSGRLRTMDFLRVVLDGTQMANMTVPGVGECIEQDVSVPLDVITLLPDWWFTGIPK